MANPHSRSRHSKKVEKPHPNPPQPETGKPTPSEGARQQRDQPLPRVSNFETLENQLHCFAHDFNNILTTILGATEMVLLKGQYHEAISGELKAVRTAARRGQELVKQILDFGPFSRPEKKPVSFQAIAQEVIQQVRATLPATIEVHEHWEADSDVIFADSTQLHQALMNILVNAAQALRNGFGKLECILAFLEVSKDSEGSQPFLTPGSYFKFMVRDTGEGIAPHVIERIFDPFFTTKKPNEGRGIGLAIAKKIITNHGGTITVKSSPGVGTIFTIFLPRITSQDSLTL